jgi:hypothetical protein
VSSWGVVRLHELRRMTERAAEAIKLHFNMEKTPWCGILKVNLNITALLVRILRVK